MTRSHRRIPSAPPVHARTLTLLQGLRKLNPSVVAAEPRRMTQDGWVQSVADIEGLCWVNPASGAIVLVSHVRMPDIATRVCRQSGRTTITVAIDPDEQHHIECCGIADMNSGAALRQGNIVVHREDARFGQLMALLASNRGADIVRWVRSEGRNSLALNLLRRELLLTAEAWATNGEPINAPNRRYLSVLLFARLLCASYLATHDEAMRRALDDVLNDNDPWSAWVSLTVDALNVPKQRRRRGPDRWAVPYLNGGLFSQSVFETQWSLTLPRERFRTLQQLFAELCTLTEMGGDALAVDPIVISHLYESALESDTRSATGSFFTPVELSRRMARLAVERLVESLEIQQANILDGLLQSTVLDPACGSGTLLVAVFDELTDRLMRLSSSGSPLTPPPTESEVRRRIVGNLCGMDTSPLAATLCELRLWLGVLAADIRCGVSLPLPNLSHRVRVGDALSSIWDFNADSPSLAVPRQVIERQRNLNERLLYATVEEKVDCIRELRDVEARIASCVHAESRAQEMTSRHPSTIPLFDPRPDGSEDVPYADIALQKREVVDGSSDPVRRAAGSDIEVAFADVLEDGGFSIVLGNPPWVRLSAVAAPQRRRICRRYDWMDTSSSRTFGVQPDLSVAFVQRAMQLVRSSGIVTMLMPSKHLSTTSSIRLRLGLLHEGSLCDLQDLHGEPAARFGAADVYPLLVCVRASSTSHEDRVVVHARGDTFHVKHHLPAGLMDDERRWLLLPEDELAVVSHLVELGRGEMAWRGFRGMYGMKTGCNAAFLGGGPQLDAWRVPVVGGRDVQTMQTKGGRGMVLPYCWRRVGALGADEVSEEVRAHFEGWRSRLEARADYGAGEPLWTVFRLTPELVGWRVVWRDIAQFVQASVLAPVSEGGAVGLNTVYVVPVGGERAAVALAAWLNLTPARLVGAALAEPALGGYRRFRASGVCQAPVGEIVWNRDHPFHEEFVRASMRWRGGDETARVRLEEMALMEVGLTDSVSVVVRASRRLGLSWDDGHFSNYVV